MSGARRISALAVVLLAAGVATACSSSGNSSGTSSPSATPAAATSAATGSTATGSAITLMVLNTENGPEANSPEDVAGAQAAAIAINASGGIDGHQVVLTVSDDAGSATTAVTNLLNAIHSGSKPDLYLNSGPSTVAAAVLLTYRDRWNVPAHSAPPRDHGRWPPAHPDTSIPV